MGKWCFWTWWCWWWFSWVDRQRCFKCKFSTMVFHPRHRVTLVVTSLVLLVVALVVVDGEMQDLLLVAETEISFQQHLESPSNPFGTPGPGGTFYFAGGGGAGKYQGKWSPWWIQGVVVIMVTPMQGGGTVNSEWCHEHWRWWRWWRNYPRTVVRR